MLICPKCRQPLTKDQHRFCCENQHSFDISKEGYVNLYLTNSANHGDNKKMVKARHDFLNYGYYNFLVAKLKQIIPKGISICDCGCGEGYYTRQLSKIGYGVDLSKSALKLASKFDVNHTYLAASISNIPLSDGCVDLVFNGFSPKFIDECVRLSRKYILFVDVGDDHLIELREMLFDQVFPRSLQPIEHPQIKLVKHVAVVEKINLAGNSEIENLISMTPYTYKCQKQKIEAVIKQSSLQVTASFVIRLYERI